MVIDPLIQDCPSLKSLEVSLYTLPTINGHFHDTKKSYYIEKSITPRPDIKSFQGSWTMMHNDNSLKYFMRKFPNLNLLNLNSDNDYFYKSTSIFSTDILQSFFEYISRIPYDVLVNCSFNMDIIDTWIKFMEATNANNKGEISIQYNRYRKYINCENIIFSGSYKHDLTATMSYHVDENSAVFLPHIQIIEKNGGKVQKLRVEYMQRLQRIVSEEEQETNERDYKMVYGYWLDHIFQNCPSLKSLQIHYPGYIALDSNNSIQGRNESLEKLEIFHLSTINHDTIFTNLSARLPSLKYFHWHTNLRESRWIERRPIVIDMPFTSFDTLVWEREQVREAVNKDEWKFHMKITTTSTGEKDEVFYFVGNCSNIRKSSAKEVYGDSLTNPEELSFDITCKKINFFSIKYKDVDQKYTMNIK